MARIVRFHEYGDASVLRIENLDVPPPDTDEVQIEVKSFGLNRAEVMLRTHAYLQEAQFPSRLGYEAAGIVKTVGTSAIGFKKGDAVSLIPPTDIARWGTYGELANVPARNLVKDVYHFIDRRIYPGRRDINELGILAYFRGINFDNGEVFPFASDDVRIRVCDGNPASDVLGS
jgi:hypothetical protein